MAEYLNKEVFLSSMGLTGDETKYGNRDAEHQHRSYSTYMSYEIMDCVDDSLVEEELVPVCRCWDCERGLRCVDGYVRCSHPSGKIILMKSSDFCSYGERKDGEG